MNYPLSSIRLRSVLTTLAALLSLLLIAAPPGASICWSGDQNVQLSTAWNPHITYFDLNADGTDDFAIRNEPPNLIFVPLGLNATVQTSYGCMDFLRPLPAGTPISSLLSPRYLWSTNPEIIASSVEYIEPGGAIDAGPWYGIGSGLLGISFQVGEHTHYGWIRMSRDFLPVGHLAFIVHEWAYETQPGAPIKAGAKPGLMLAPQVVRAGYLRLKWRREVGKSYRVEATTRLDAPTWTYVWSPDRWITPTEMAVEVRMEGRAQFFRVVEPD